MGVDQQAHRAGALKQKNKAHKTGRHRSKGAIDNELKGTHFVNKTFYEFLFLVNKLCMYVFFSLYFQVKPP